MPSQELFEDQDATYRESVLPASVTKRLAVEAGTSFGWHKYMGFHGASASIDELGASTPGTVCLEKLGYTVDHVIKEAKTLLGLPILEATAVSPFFKQPSRASSKSAIDE